MKENINFDINKVGCLISWTNRLKPQPEGYSVVSNTSNLSSALSSFSDNGTPCLKLFSDLESFLDGEESKWFNLPGNGPENRNLTFQEKKAVYDIMMPDFIKMYSPQFLAETIMPMYYNKF